MPKLFVVLVAAVVVFTNLFLIQPVAPLLVAHAGGDRVAAGLVTGLFSAATVALEIGMAFLLRRYDIRWLLTFGAALLGLGTLAYAAVDDNVPAMLGLAVVRGAGSGMAFVAAAVLASQVASPERRAEAMGTYGLVVLLPGIVAPSLGIYVATTSGFGVVFVFGGLTTLAGAVAPAFIRLTHAAEAPTALGVISVARRLTSPLLGLALVTLTYGALVTFAPLILGTEGVASATTFFLVFGILRAVARWTAGVADRPLGSWNVLLVGIVLTLAGTLVLATGRTAVPVVLGGILYGAGFGTVLNATYVRMLERVPRTEFGTVGSAWNFAFDGGHGIGGAVFGVIAASFGDSAILLALPVPVAVGLALHALDRGPIRTATRAAPAAPGRE